MNIQRYGCNYSGIYRDDDEGALVKYTDVEKLLAEPRLTPDEAGEIMASPGNRPLSGFHINKLRAIADSGKPKDYTFEVAGIEYTVTSDGRVKIEGMNAFVDCEEFTMVLEDLWGPDIWKSWKITRSNHPNEPALKIGCREYSANDIREILWYLEVGCVEAGVCS